MAYYTLIASLPHLPAHFDVARPPITRPRLESRFRLLTEDDARTLGQLADFLAWDRQPLNRSDDQVVLEYQRLKEATRHSLVLELMEHRIDVRTIVGALRRRRNGDGPPVGVGRLVEPIRRSWTEPWFGLQRRFDWIDAFDDQMRSGEAVTAERVLYETTWQTWCRLAARFTFSFEAVLLYWARWEIVERWTSRDAAAGQTRFDQLIEETLCEYASLRF